ncbi:MAG: acetylglutamate kinase [Pseudomonadota bacterium]
MSDTNPSEQAAILAAALPNMQRHDGAVIVVKYGGNAMVNVDLGRAFARDVALLRQSGVRPVVVHGGGPQIGAWLDKVGIKSEFRAGLRVTDEAAMEVVEMVLAGNINKRIVTDLNAEGTRAIGLSGKDGGMVRARKAIAKEDGKVVDLGFVGEPEAVNPSVLRTVTDAGLIPVVAPVAFGDGGESYNINADTFAGAVAGAMDATRLLFLTDVPGVLDGNGNLLPRLTVSEARGLIADGTVSGGMIPKVETCIEALERGVEAVVIVNGKVAHAVLLELFTDHGAGTMIVPDEETA